MRHFDVEDHDGDDDGEDLITKGFQSSFAHMDAGSYVLPRLVDNGQKPVVRT